MATYYRVVNELFEKARVNSTDTYCPPDRVRFNEVLPYLQLATKYSLISEKSLTSLLSPMWMFAVEPQSLCNVIGGDEEWKLALCYEFLEIDPPFEPFNIDDCRLIWEYIWEFARQQVFPEATSRLNCIMLWHSREDAERFLQTERCGDVIVEVQVHDDSGASDYDMSWLDDVPTDATARAALTFACKYWNRELTQHPVMEVLYSGGYEIQ